MSALQDTASHRDPDSQWQPTYARHVSPKYAIVAIAGHQLIVEEGRWYEVNRLKAPPGSTIRLGRVLAHKHDGDIEFGRPYLPDVAVHAFIMEETLGKKIRVFKFKPKKHYKRARGHRQRLTRFLVTSIAGDAEPLAAEAETALVCEGEDSDLSGP